MRDGVGRGEPPERKGVSWFLEDESMNLAILSAIFLAATLATAQEGTPSKAQCEGDAIVWNLTPDSLQTLQDGPISATEIDTRRQVLLGCALTYTPMQESHYRVLAEVYDHAYNIRLMNFLKRHPEIRAKFLQDDQAGLR
jgi:hypothetical protein